MNTTAPTPILHHLAALGDETRTRILALLEEAELTVSELQAALQIPQPRVSRHLRTLAEDGWVVSRSEGRNRHYRMSPDLDDPSRSLWHVVRGELLHGGVYAEDLERAEQVLARRRRRSAEFFAASADRWDLVRRDLFGGRASLLPLLGLLDARWTVGDLGAGTGSLTAELAPYVSRVIAVDQSAAMLAAARDRLEGSGNVELRRGDLERLPIEGGELDLAIFSLVLHYVVDPRAALREAFRALRPGGRLIVVEPREHDRGPEFAEQMGHVWSGFDPDRFGRWVDEAGYAETRTQPLPPDPDAAGPSLFLTTAARPAAG